MTAAVVVCLISAKGNVYVSQCCTAITARMPSRRGADPATTGASGAAADGQAETNAEEGPPGTEETMTEVAPKPAANTELVSHEHASLPGVDI